MRGEGHYAFEAFSIKTGAGPRGRSSAHEKISVLVLNRSHGHSSHVPDFPGARRLQAFISYTFKFKNL